MLGAVYAGVFDFAIGEDEKAQRVPTNYTYGVPSHYFVNSLSQVTTNDVFMKVRSESISIRQFVQQAQSKNVLTGEPMGTCQLPW